MQADDLIERLDVIGLKSRAYSGRMMFGAYCVATVIPALRDIALLGPDLRDGLEVDGFGLEFVVYWPFVRLPAGHELFDEQDD